MKSFMSLSVSLSSLLIIIGITVATPQFAYSATAIVTRDQDNPARHAYFDSCTVSSSSSNNGQNSCTFNTIPTGEEVVMEEISFEASGSAARTTMIAKLIITNLAGALHIISKPCPRFRVCPTI